MIKIKGRSSLKQYVPMKPIKLGFEVWTLADIQPGYVCRFHACRNKESSRKSSIGEHVVKTMVSVLEYSYGKVYFDNYFTSPCRIQYLYKNSSVTSFNTFYQEI